MFSYSRKDLKELGHDYELAVAEREITIYTNYIADGIVTYAKKGLNSIRFPILKKNTLIEHSLNGNLNKYDPGPIYPPYLTEILLRLSKTFPDTTFVIEGGHLVVDWS